MEKVIDCGDAYPARTWGISHAEDSGDGGPDRGQAGIKSQHEWKIATVFHPPSRKCLLPRNVVLLGGFLSERGSDFLREGAWAPRALCRRSLLHLRRGAVEVGPVPQCGPWGMGPEAYRETSHLV